MVAGDVIAVMGAALGAAILTGTLLYMRTLPGATPALGWWAAAMAITTTRQLVFLAGLTTPLPFADFIFEALVAFGASFFLGGALVFMGRRPRHVWIGGTVVAILAWLAIAHHAELGFFARVGPPFLGASLALLLTGALFLRYRRSHPHLGYGFVGTAFILWGIHLAAYPFLRPNPATLPWGFTVTQGINLAIALGLILSVQRRQAAELVAANRRAESSAEHASHAQERLVGAVEGLESGIALFDRDDRMVMCNPAFRTITQLGDILQPGLSFIDYLRARVASGLLPVPAGMTAEEFIAERYAQHRKPRGPIERRMLDGRWFHIREHRLQDGSCMIFLYDMTATKERERELAEKTALLQGTMDNMGEGISVFDAQLRLVAWNERLIELTGHPRSLFRVGTPMADFIHHNAQRGEYGPGDPEERAQEALRIGTLPHPQRQARWRATGRYVELRRNPIPGGGFVTVYSDITERKQVEDALRDAKEAAEAANRTKSGILANMSHELRTPLNAIIGFSDIIRKESFGPIGEKRYLSYAVDINDSGTHLLALINDILDVSKAEAGRIELSEGVIDIPSLFDTSLRLVRPRADEAGVTLIAAPTEHLPRLRGDTLRLKQVLINLLSNAIKFTPSGGRVTLSSGLSGGAEVYLRVEDTGIGMAPQDIPKALSPFGQLDSSLARKHHGTGLGLPLSKALVELHGGRLELQSTAGAGTSVSVYLPAARVLAA
jgi:PAS domain S-box-containing protein